ncbi:class I SAM-dependent methyltransferase [Streptomyces sp. BE308]|uniref:class I SAM-dependent methyltransferase n=1 Tax=unclassified Streptomyces TaxID=2593676 RepID=UPI002DD9254D|nr:MULTISPECIES: class I SAM-dependent methyltransferase [unclassified Streptomyces]MEE1795760.1 class I SAM-dependent methyltransferase [Streptomyces sp. BE308]WRZ70841.1 class I SAM-dependent methyltransferase [Streptomyces sp. NBC_01237]
MDEDRHLSAAAAFDSLGADYERAFAHSAAHHASLHRLLEDLAPGSRVLDVGCGTGRPTAQTLADAGHEVLGVDVSPVMTEIAARQVPGAAFRCADIRTLPLPGTDAEEEGFDAVCAYFSLLQMSREDQSRLLSKLGRSLRPGGRLVVATVPLDVEDAGVVFMGRPVRVTSFGAEEFTALVVRAGFAVQWQQDSLFTPAHPAGEPEPQLFLHCRRL